MTQRVAATCLLVALAAAGSPAHGARAPLYVLVDEVARAEGLVEGPRGRVGNESAYVLRGADQPRRTDTPWLSIPGGAELRLRVGLDAGLGRFGLRARGRSGRSMRLLARTLDRDDTGWVEERILLDDARARLGPKLRLEFKARARRRLVPLWGDPIILGPAPPKQTNARRNVVLVSIDTLRADRVGAYGGPPTPTLDRLAREGTLFEIALAGAPWTRPSHATMLTGVFACAHGLGSDLDARLPAGLSPLAEILRRQGYVTGAITEGGYLDEQAFGRGFGSFRVNAAGTRDAPAGRVEAGVADARAWLTRHADEPFFLFLHTYQPHAPYTPPGAGRDAALPGRNVQASRELYDREVRQTDQALAPLFATLDTLGLRKRTLVIVTSDHGEGFGEHGHVLHGRQLHEEDLRVPLIWWAPGLIPAGRRISAVAGLADLVTTVCDLLGIAPPPWSNGRSLARALLADPPVIRGEHMVYSEALDQPGKGYRVAVRGTGWKSIFSYPYREGSPMTMFRLFDDPGERDEVDISNERLTWPYHFVRECVRASALLAERTARRPADG
jgi:arylsulfatase A-like enzyme